jgi:RimJ/RimL family protein N-acetyltransferase
MTLNFNTENNYILENDSVRLEPLQERHVEFLKLVAIQDIKIWEFSTQEVCNSESFYHYFELALTNKNNGTEYPFAVFDKQSNQYVGSTRFYDINLKNRTVQLGYTWYGKAFQGTGINKNCKYLLLNFAFKELEVERVEFRADSTNIVSIQAMKSIGCTTEGVLRSHMPKISGGRRDTIVLSILKHEWLENLENILKNKL